MKKYALAALLLAVLKSSSWAVPHSGDAGLGVVIGDVTGPTVKYFIGPKTALDLGLGFSSEFRATANITWHSWDIFPRPEQGQFGGYLGFGPRWQERNRRDDDFGIRAIAGVDYWLQPAPLEIFFEFGPWFVMSPDTDTEFDAGLGVRYYFSAGGSSRRR